MGWFFSISAPAFRIPEQPHPSHKVTVYAAELGKGTDTPLQQCQTLPVLQTRAQFGTLFTSTTLILIPYTNLATHFLFVLVFWDVFNRLAGKVLLFTRFQYWLKSHFCHRFHPSSCISTHDDEMPWQTVQQAWIMLFCPPQSILLTWWLSQNHLMKFSLILQWLSCVVTIAIWPVTLNVFTLPEIWEGS